MILTAKFRDALMFAAQLHAGQFRKGTPVPYVTHLLSVASIALEYGANEDEAIAALLHDAIEDQGGAVVRERIRQLFGEVVVQIVDGCTDTDVMPKPPWQERKEAYIKHLQEASPSIRLVSAADKLHNARTLLSDYRQMGEALWKRFTGGKEGSLWYYRTLTATYHSLGPQVLADELDRVVTELEALTRKP